MVKLKGLKEKRMLPALIITTLLLSGTGAALYLANMSFTGSVTVAGGEQPASDEYVWNLDMNAGETDTQSFVYDNLDGDSNFMFTTDTTGINSTDPKCIFQPGEDLSFNVSVDGQEGVVSDTLNQTFLLVSGNNDITIKTTTHSSTCPLTGTISLLGELV